MFTLGILTASIALRVYIDEKSTPENKDFKRALMGMLAVGLVALVASVNGMVGAPDNGEAVTDAFDDQYGITLSEEDADCIVLAATSGPDRSVPCPTVSRDSDRLVQKPSAKLEPR